MQIFYIYIVLLVFTVYGDTGCDKTKCIGEQKLYREIGCTPVIEEGQCCASRYNCPDFTTLDIQKCHYKNEVFEVRSTLPSEITTPLCEASCYCREASLVEGPAAFSCAQIECPELFRYEKDCIYPVKKGDCCTKKKICGDDRNSLVKCHLDGRDYYEGEKMYPETVACHTCTCTKDFDYSKIIGNPHCSEVDCGLPLRNTAELQKGCTPVYYGSPYCCPIDWRCPEKDDTIDPKGKSESVHKCSFGSLKLNIGDEVMHSDETITCTCAAPPFVQCVKVNK